MRCHIIETGVRIAPSLDPVGDTPVANRPLRSWQEEAIQRCGLELAEAGAGVSGPCVVLPDNLFVTWPLMKAFLAEVLRLQPLHPAALKLERSAMVHENHHLQGLEVDIVAPNRATAKFPLVYLPAGADWSPDLEALAVVPVMPQERVVEMDVPEHYFGKPKTIVPLTSMSAMVLRHWSHIVRANLAALGAEGMSDPWWRKTGRILWALVTALPPTKARIMRRISRIGRGCKIHPTAVVEASTIGDGVTIGANAVVSFSTIGDGAWVQDLAKVSLSVLGEKSFVTSGTMMNFCVLYPEAAASQRLMQLTVLGRKCITTGGAFLMDMHFDEDIKVPIDGELTSVGSRFMGSAIGHGARLGTGFWLAPGRAIPNGMTIVRQPEDVIRSVPAEAPEGAVVSDRGRLVPLDTTE